MLELTPNNPVADNILAAINSSSSAGSFMTTLHTAMQDIEAFNPIIDLIAAAAGHPEIASGAEALEKVIDSI